MYRWGSGETDSELGEREGREVKTLKLRVDPRDLFLNHSDLLKSPKALSAHLFSQALPELEKTLEGDSGEKNWALLIFEEALDWRVGCGVLYIIKAALEKKGLPKPFEVLIDSRGRATAKFPSGREIEL